MGNLVFIQNDQVLTDSLTVAECFGKRHADVLRDIEVQIEKLNEADQPDFVKRNFALSSYRAGTREYKKYLLTEEAFTLVAFAYVTPEAMKMKVRFIEEFKRMKEALQKQLQPKTQAEMLLMYAQQLVEQERRMKQIEEQVEVVKHRLDNIDNINTIGDPQQRLNAMIRLYALQNGLYFSKAWADFRDAFNTAYRTNLTLRMNNYKRTTGKRKITMPEYLSEVGQLEDAIRVADKLLNRGNKDVRNLWAN
ncbi:Rha family transcriptional regulator [Geobacillus phage vB_GthS_NIIg9.7]|nr:Rha family transcriptional regulator [Geobacillus phage vB_GthS_NIIg9.7]